MASFLPGMSVRSNRTLVVNRANTFSYVYRLGGVKKFPPYTSTALLEFHNTYGQQVAVFWGDVVNDSEIHFFEEASATDDFETTTSWRLTVEIDGYPRLLEQGIVVRDEAPWPDQPPKSSAYDGVRYQYSFDNPGRLVDPSWEIKNGQPHIYNNASRNLPNAVAAGGGLFDDVAMLWWAPLRTDAVRMTYNTIRSSSNSNGQMWVVICSNSDMTNWAGFRHNQKWGIGHWDSDSIDVVRGTGPTELDVRVTDDYDTATNQEYTAEYNPISNTYALYVGTSLTPLISWQDDTELVNHGEGERYVGFGFKSSALQPGVQCSDWIIGDNP